MLNRRQGQRAYTARKIVRDLAKHRLVTRVLWALAATTLVGLQPAFADEPPTQPPVPYVQTNDGTQGFLDQGGVRLRTERDRGIRLGNIVLWPTLFIESRWDSNVFQQDAQDVIEPTNAALFRFLPGIAISNLKPNKLAFTFGLLGDARVYVSDDEAVKGQNNIGGNADLRLDILPNGPVTITLLDTFRRSLQSQNVSTDQTFNVNANRAGLRVGIHPGGRALDLTLGYAYLLHIFDDTTNLNWQSHNFLFRGTWRFYPKTFALLEATLAMKDWDSEAYGDGQFVDHKALRLWTGLSGFWTKRLTTLIKIGYGNSLHDAGPSFENVIAHVELGYKITDGILLAGGFLRDYSQTSFLGNFFVENRTYLRTQFDFLQRVRVDGMVAYSLVDYAEYDPAALGVSQVFVSHKERRDQVIRGNIRVDVDITRWIGVGVGYEVTAVLSNYFTENLSLANRPRDYGAFTRHQVYGTVNVRY